ncbi:MAG: DEAD/DEAH box helicase family protein [Candidatus Levybacteria bacterium]|nr:DEAD/DEAH box helicase family protein [Candidatus Levybacteria bacterium]
MSDKYLYEELKEKAFDYGISKSQVPDFIVDNLKYPLFDWQKRAIENFLTYEEIRNTEGSVAPLHLMFNMATGTGKTLVMAAMILYFYKKGHRNFIFFVNQNNIVDKTENNFVNKSHSKYQFKQNIVIENKTLQIKKVETFSKKSDDIQIKFTSIHKLHNAVYSAKENAVFLEELQKQDLIMLGDEAHHFNATTKKNKQNKMELESELPENASQDDIERSWENTVIKKILNKGKEKQDTRNNNALLEFTATIPKDQSVDDKYRNKTIYKFTLESFLDAGYTKEINLVSSTLNKKERILSVLLLNWYRHSIALKNNIPNFKPVILFRSKTIEDSRKDFSEFLELVNKLKPQDFNFIKSIDEKFFEGKNLFEKGQSRILAMTKFVKDEKIKFSEIIDWVQYSFTERNCIITNSKDNKAKTKESTTEDQEKLLNSLEDSNNHIRAIFTVKRLTEGWDVLNLFDIVRLYEGRDEGHDINTGERKAGDSTISEIQLIGRGVRYLPFKYQDRELNKRKFDNELDNPMRVLEEFNFHCFDDNRGHFIDELKRELKRKGFIKDNRINKKFDIKQSFKDSEFYKTVKIFLNHQIENNNKRKNNLGDIKKNFIFEYRSKIFSIKEEQVELGKTEDTTLLKTRESEKKTLLVKLNEFDKNIIYKALNIHSKKDNSLYRFNHLNKEFEVESINDLVEENVLGNLKLNIITLSSVKGLNDIDQNEKLDVLLNFFEKLEIELRAVSNPYLGTEFKGVKFSEVFGEPKEKAVEINDESKRIESELIEEDWYVLNGFNGTSEERGLVNFLKDKIGNLKSKYEEIYLLRNEEVYKIYDFEKGRGFQPDFLLFLKHNKHKLYYQVFIEPKGSQFVDKSGEFTESKEAWKEEFLTEISKRYAGKDVLKLENKEYKLVGLPLFNERIKTDFDNEFNKHLLETI